MTAAEICEYVMLGLYVGFGAESLCWACSKLFTFLDKVG